MKSTAQEWREEEESVEEEKFWEIKRIGVQKSFNTLLSWSVYVLEVYFFL